MKTSQSTNKKGNYDNLCDYSPTREICLFKSSRRRNFSEYLFFFSRRRNLRQKSRKLFLAKHLRKSRKQQVFFDTPDSIFYKISVQKIQEQSNRTKFSSPSLLFEEKSKNNRGTTSNFQVSHLEQIFFPGA